MARPKPARSPAPLTGVTGAPEEVVVGRIAEAMRAASGPAPAGSVWIGDDAAVVVPPVGRLVLAADAVVAGVHADLDLVGLDDLGWKAMTAAVSDIAAVGGRPGYALVTICAPGGADLERLAAGIAGASARWGCPVVGGDVTAAGEVVVSVAVTGVLTGTGEPVLRSGAMPGDAIMVTGPLGSSAAGLRILRAMATETSGGMAGAALSDEQRALVSAHRRPQARLAEGTTARAAGATAMMDLSDGLGLDLNRLADASGVGVQLVTVPAAPGATEEEALAGGEDFELLVATPDPARLSAAFLQAGLRPPITIGCCTAQVAERSLRGQPLDRRGYEHRLG